ncbi:ArsR/SmtB family transcription factor [Nocardia panacis]|uniref:ArsR/SmtB family transcription factor n=1 Tax=Nocardia panacis TaxID=2340916 RepID=UPI001EF05827|nr:helix-turn-helix domain-containing protein [Nocardia panacis]
MDARAADLAGLAALLADRTRAAMCLAMIDGRAWSAGELARTVRVAPSTATEHLNRLLAGGLLAERRQGRHRYVELADARAAELIEALATYIGAPPVKVTGLKTATASAALSRGRTCYDHLAGRLGVAITDALTEREFLRPDPGFALTAPGMAFFTGPLGIDPALLHTRRPLTRPCLDWTERRTHLGGAAGAQLCRRLRELDWIVGVGTGRAVRATSAGEVGLHDLLGINPATLR